MNPGGKTRGPLLRLALLVLFVLALHGPFLSWGAPQATAPSRTYPFAADDLGPLGALAEMHNTFVHSKPDRNYAYPWFHYALTAGAQAPYLLLARMRGSFDAPQAEYPFGFDDPVTALYELTLVARVLTLLMTVLVVLLTYGMATELMNRRAGLIAASLTACNYLVTYYGGTGNLDLPMTFWCTLGAYFFVRMRRRLLSKRTLYLLALAAGLGMGTKDQALFTFLPIGLALLVPAIVRTGSFESRGWLILKALVISLLAYAFAAGMFFDPMRHVTHVRKTLFEPQSLSVMHYYYTPFERTLEGQLGLLRDFGNGLLRALSPFVCLLAACGALLHLLRRPADVTLLLPLPLTYVLLIVPTGITPIRYLLPMVPIVDVFAALFLARLMVNGLVLGKLLFTIALLLRLTIAADLRYAQWNETRYGAQELLAQHARPGDRVEFFGADEKLPGLDTSVQSRRILGREEGWQGEFDHGPAVLEALRAEDAPAFVLLIPDWTSRPGMRRSQDCPPEVEQALEEGLVPYDLLGTFETARLLPRFLPELLVRPRLDNPSVSPPVRVFAHRRALARE